MVFDRARDHPSPWAVVKSISEIIGDVPRTPYEWPGKAEDDGGKRAGMPIEVMDVRKQWSD